MKGRFLATLAVAAIAALAIVPWLIAAAPVLGFSPALGVFAAFASAAYLFVIAPNPAPGLRAALLAGAAIGATSILLPGGSTRLLALLLVLGLVRSGFFFRRRPARALAVETALGLLSMLAVEWFAGHTVLSWAMAVWGLGLAQSLFFLAADIEVRDDAEQGDAFVGAHERAMRLLEMTGR